ncbi:chorismate lyase [Aquisalimonas sp.]|uniref:chorismate--pyruvate lyase family protein n=1 Tax=Aquisalimonas sp. TaxID=1872621 RepID=UPI0025C62CA3|nr:chorismate lyase [Aquisalimonas sp.]
MGMRYCRPFCGAGASVRQAFCQWRIRDGRPGARVPSPERAWVVETGSLTAGLRQRCGRAFNVRVLDQGWYRPALDEAWRLHLERRHVAWVRQVALCCGNQPLILARTVIPPHSLRSGNETLRHLGARPLGELLFRGGGTPHEPMEVARLRAGDWLAERMGGAGLSPASGCWARRVVHYLRGRPLLVAEIFLPELFHCQP